MDNISDLTQEHRKLQRTSPHQEVVVSPDGRLSFRSSEDPTQAASFLGSKSDVVSQTVSLTSLLSSHKSPFRDSGLSSSKKPTKSALQQRWEAQTRKTFPLSTETPKAKSASARTRSPQHHSVHAGNTLYLKGLQMQENLKRKVQQKLISESLAEKEFFKPKVDENSNLLSPRSYISVEDSLLSWGSQKEEKLSKLKSSQSQAELEICSFSPKLDPKSVHLAAQRQSDNPRFVELFQLATEQKDRKSQQVAELHAAECPFRPRIFVEKKVQETREEFIQRLYTSKSKPGDESSKPEAEVEDNGVIEEEPIQKVVVRNDRPSSVSIYEYLYSLREKQLEDSETKPAPSPIEENTASHKVFASYQQSCISAIFSALDQNRDGVISGRIYPVSSLNDKQFSVLKPFFKEIERSGEEWDLDRFEQRANQFIAGLNVEDRGYALTRVKAVALSEKQSPKPPMRKSVSGSPVLFTSRVTEVLFTQRTLKSLEKLAAERKRKEAEECSFKPFLSSLNRQRYVDSKSIR